MRIKTLLLLACVGLSCFSCKDDEQEPEAANPFLIKPGDATQNVAHRGGTRLYPENTLVAFDSAALLGVDVLEMDVHLTKDSVLVTIHDESVDRTCDTAGNVIDFTYDELKAFNFGYNFQATDGSYPYRAHPVRIPRLEDILARHGNALMVIEIKDAATAGMRAADKLLALLRQYDMQKKVAVFSFSDDVMDYFHSINTEGICTGASLTDGLSFVLAVRANPDTTLAVRAGMFAFPQVMLSVNLTSDTIIRAAHRHNVAIHYWTINDKNTMKTLIQKGADGVMTDRPDLMKEALQELGF